MSSPPAASAVHRAQVLLDARRPEEALELLAHAVASDPEDLRAHCLMALALIRLNRPGDATRAAERGAAVDPSAEWPQRLRALALLAQGRKRQALEAANEAVRLAPEVAQTHIVLASAEAARSHLRAAREAAARAVELAPEDANAHATLGEIALRQGDAQDAERAYRTALSLDPEDAAAHNNLGVALDRLGRHAEAREAYTAAARFDPRQEVSPQNVARNARQFITGGGWAVAIAATIVLQIIRAAMDSTHSSADVPAAIAVVLLAVVAGGIGILIFQRHREEQLTPVERALLRDRRAHYRRRPWEWRPAYVYMPWPILVLRRIPAPISFVICLMATIALVPGAQHHWPSLAAFAVLTAWTGYRTRLRLLAR